MNLVKSVLVVTASKELDEEVKKGMAAPEVSVAKLLRNEEQSEDSRGDDRGPSSSDSE